MVLVVSRALIPIIHDKKSPNSCLSGSVFYMTYVVIKIILRLGMNAEYMNVYLKSNNITVVPKLKSFN